MDPIIIPIADLARAGINVTRAPWDGRSLSEQRYNAEGHAEMSRYGVYSLARQFGVPEQAIS